MNSSQILLISRSLARHRLIVCIFVMQMTITTAAIMNIASLLTERVKALRYETGLNESGLALVETEFLGEATKHISALVQSDLHALKRMPGVSGAVVLEALPLSRNDWTVGISNEYLDHDRLDGFIEAEPSLYAVSAGALDVLGIELISGSDFSSEAYVPMMADEGNAGLYKADEAIISNALASKLFPEGGALGKAIYLDGQHPLRIVGIVRHMSRPLLRNDTDNALSMLVPLLPDGHRVIYAIRTDQSNLQNVLGSGRRLLLQNEVNRLIPRAMTFSDLRSDYFRRDSTMASVFLSAGAALLVVTGIGIYGLASFWVRQRYLHVGIRRALGARKQDITRYFLLENLLLSSSGALLGALLAIAINVEISRYFGAPKLEASFLGLGVVLICALGQVAAWLPVSRATRDAPIVTLRSA